MQLLVDGNGILGPLPLTVDECKKSCNGQCKKLLINLDSQITNTYVCTTSFDLITFQMVTGIASGLSFLILIIILLIMLVKCVGRCVCGRRRYK